LTSIAIACVVALLAVSLLIGRLSHPTLAARNAFAAPPTVSSDNRTAPTAPLAAAASEPSPVTTNPEIAESPAPAAAAKNSLATPATQNVDGVTDFDPHKSMGSKTAPIAIEVFSDFQCPACKSLYTTTMKQVVENYVNTGKVYLIHRDYPLPMHAYSKVAARYATAAAHIGKFEPVEQVLFQKQEVWEQSGDVDGTVAGVLSAADMTKVRAVVKGGTLDAEIDKDSALGQTYHITQTPTTIVHHKGQTYPVVGQQSYAIFHDFLDQLLGMK
jgi:protein-disulfide isomerase